MELQSLILIAFVLLAYSGLIWVPLPYRTFGSFLEIFAIMVIFIVIVGIVANVVDFISQYPMWTKRLWWLF
jgi:hypothetical protein